MLDGTAATAVEGSSSGSVLPYGRAYATAECSLSRAVALLLHEFIVLHMTSSRLG